MADSRPRTEPPGRRADEAAPGDAAPVPPQGSGTGGFTAVPAPWGDSVPWWSAEGRAGTGPQRVADPSGPQAVVPDASGPHRMPNGTGPHRMPDGTGPLPPVPPVPPVPSFPDVPRRRGSGMLLGAGAGAVLLVVLVAGVLMLRSGDATGQTSGKRAKTATAFESTRTIAAGATAGGLRRDSLPARAAVSYPFVTGGVEAGGIPPAAQGSAVYTGSGQGGALDVLFVGGTGRVEDAPAFLRKIRPTTFIGGQNANPGQAGGEAACGTFAVLGAVHTYCAWATGDSYGIVASNVASRQPRYAMMDAVMLRIRADVERPR
ncbi:hypothetical protein [Actinomadura sp. WMMB 499]|uniref:hypothetical protein n=1 Tax=Actinomadura sp. WMMB 499 TaxID=1219491 RepID=UPI0012461F2E|nr:hypothetical protein [Actinomadura sp. WMMB 499]QFG21082.1 hypothetical protein F7P10_07935 [Actinomadura sp. WMMB 499]